MWNRTRTFSIPLLTKSNNPILTMCFSAPKTATPPPTPAPPPPPTAVAETVQAPSMPTEAKKRTAGISSLIIRRPTVSTGTSGMGSSVNY